MRALAKIALTLTAVGAMAFTATAGTLEDVKARGVLRCVVSTGIAGFAYPDADG
ncbi:MAG TPA: amino acid ABC transporter substrate-binding protein, partial [Deltaproteobacteria bacterium]|nr:amino acid ABC transporter substrate-binding protein [Deltaproteobacteria bacterium]